MTCTCGKRGEVSDGNALAVDLGQYLAPAEYQSTMADFLHLVEVGGNQKHSTTGFLGYAQIAVDFRFGSDIHPNRRLLENKQASIGFHPPRDYHFLLIAAAQGRNRAGGVRGPHGEFRQRHSARTKFLAVPDRTKRRDSPGSRVHIQVLQNRKVVSEAFLRPAAGDEADTIFYGIRGIGNFEFTSLNDDSPGVHRQSPIDRPTNSVVSSAAQTHEGKGLARIDLQRYGADQSTSALLGTTKPRSVNGKSWIGVKEVDLVRDAAKSLDAEASPSG